VPRILPERTRAVLEKASWPRPAVFEWLQREGKIAEGEMHRVFNCGIGMAVVVAAKDADAAIRVLSNAGETVFPHRPHRSAQSRRASGRGGLKMEKRIERIIQVVAGIALAIGCLMVLKPFLAALLSAAILCFFDLAVYTVIERRLGGRRTLAALAMTLLMVLVLVLPLALIAGSYVDDVPQLAEKTARHARRGTAQAPRLGRLDPAGGRFRSTPAARDSRQQGGARGSAEEDRAAGARSAGASRHHRRRRSAAVHPDRFIGFFFYRDGAALAARPAQRPRARGRRCRRAPAGDRRRHHQRR